MKLLAAEHRIEILGHWGRTLAFSFDRQDVAVPIDREGVLVKTELGWRVVGRHVVGTSLLIEVLLSRRHRERRLAQV